jgi:transposase-like protein
MEELMANSKNNLKLPPNSGEQAGAKVIQRWSAARKREIVLCLLRGESFDAVSREIGVEPYRLERWRGKALAAMDAGLRSGPTTILSRPVSTPPTSGSAS